MIISFANKKSFVVLCILMLGGLAKAQHHIIKNNVQFITRSFQTALKLARQQNKLVFVDAYASWCAPCKRLKTVIFTNQKVANYFNEHYINFSIDVEKGEGIKLGEDYLINSYPTLLFVDTNGQIIRKIEGFVDGSMLLHEAASIK